MTLRGYYLQAARLQREYARMFRRDEIHQAIATRLGRLIHDHASMKRYRIANWRAERTRTRAAELLLAAMVARAEARDRMYFDAWEAQRERRREEFIRRNWS